MSVIQKNMLLYKIKINKLQGKYPDEPLIWRVGFCFQCVKYFENQSYIIKVTKQV